MAVASRDLEVKQANQPQKAGFSWASGLLIAMFVAFPLTLLLIWIAPTDAELKYSQRIFYFHFPFNIYAFAAFFMYFVGAIGYWRTRQRQWDILMLVGLEIGMMFATVGIVTGSIWAAYAWGTFWTWDPRLTTVTIMMVVYLAGWMLRGSVEDPNRKAALTAVFGIIGFVNVPLVFFSTRFFPAGLHPVIFKVNASGKETSTGLDGFMNVVLIGSTLTVGLLFAYLCIQRFKLEEMRDDVSEVRAVLYEADEE